MEIAENDGLLFEAAGSENPENEKDEPEGEPNETAAVEGAGADAAIGG